MTFHYSIVVVREKGLYWSYVPDMPGAYGTGKTAALAKTDLAEALKLYIEDCRADGDPVPRSAAKVVAIDQVAVQA